MAVEPSGDPFSEASSLDTVFPDFGDKAWPSPDNTDACLVLLFPVAEADGALLGEMLEGHHELAIGLAGDDLPPTDTGLPLVILVHEHRLVADPDLWPAIRRLAASREAPIILLTEMPAAPRHDPIDDFLVLPVSPAELLARIRLRTQARLRDRGEHPRERRLRARAEMLTRQFETLIENLPIGASLVNLDGRVVVANAVYRALMPQSRIPSVDPIADSNWTAFDENGNRLVQNAYPGSRALRGETVHGIDFKHHPPDEPDRWVRVSAYPILHEERGITGIVTMLQDIDEERRAQERQAMLVRELNHRLKNMISMVKAIANQTMRTTSSPMAFTKAFGDRLDALARAQDMLLATGQRGMTPLRAIVEQTLGQHRDHGHDMGSGGPDVLVAAESSIMLNLAFHELATNALKYGSLKNEDGKVSVTWSLDEEGRRLELLWHETGGPPVEPRRHRGFGSTLIEHGLASELGGEVTLEFQPDGLRCSISIPLCDKVMPG